MKLYRFLSLAMATLFLSTVLFSSESQAQTKLRIQSGFPPSSLIYLNSLYFAKQVNAMSGGRLVIEILPPGAVVPPFEILDAVSRKVVDGGHTAAAYWVGKNRAAALFSPAPGGPFGMDMMDYLGWIHDAGGLQLYADFYQKDLKANVVPIPLTSVAQQALGWFKTPIKSWADLKGKKCRHTGITAEVFGRAGVAEVARGALQHWLHRHLVPRRPRHCHYCPVFPCPSRRSISHSVNGDPIDVRFATTVATLGAARTFSPSGC